MLRVSCIEISLCEDRRRKIHLYHFEHVRSLHSQKAMCSSLRTVTESNPVPKNRNKEKHAFEIIEVFFSSQFLLLSVQQPSILMVCLLPKSRIQPGELAQWRKYCEVKASVHAHSWYPHEYNYSPTCLFCSSVSS